jgi:hypothetical protein
MDFLLDDKLAPITSSIGFLEKDLESVVNAYEDWKNEVLTNYGFFVRREAINESFVVSLSKLQPLVSPIPTKFLFIAPPTS